MLESPVLRASRHDGAILGEAFGWNVPRTYTTREAEYEAATQGFAIADRSYVGRLRINGDDAVDLLDRLSTNRLSDLEEGSVMGTVITNNKGRIIDVILLLRKSDHLMAFTGAETRQRVADWIGFYTFAEDVTVVDETETTAMLSLLGPKAATAVKGLGDLTLHQSSEIEIGGVQATAVRTDFSGAPGYDIVVPAASGDDVWTALVDMGAEPVGTDALDLVRIENGGLAIGAELSEDYNPLEAGLINFISFNKGCYIGQEVVARLDTYDKVQKHLVLLSWEPGEAVSAGAKLYSEGKEVGKVTSAAQGISGAGEGLGYIRNAQAEAGTVLTTEVDVSVQVGEAVRHP